MKAVRIHAYEADPVVEEIPEPEIAPDEVLVRVAAAALNPLDVKLQRGYLHEMFPVEFPHVLGTDLAGTIDQLGAEVTDWSVGDPVVARLDPSRGGAVAELAAVPAAQLVSAPSAVPIEQAAGIPTTGGTAYQALIEMAELKAGQTVLVHAAAGGVGSFAVQLAHKAGARVIATASGTGLDIAWRLGADEVIDYTTEDFAATVTDVDLVLDPVGGETQQRSYSVLRDGGLLLALEPPDLTGINGRDIKADFVIHMSNAERLRTVVEQVEDGTEVLIDRTVALDDFADGFAHQAAGHARGKILITA